MSIIYISNCKGSGSYSEAGSLETLNQSSEPDGSTKSLAITCAESDVSEIDSMSVRMSDSEASLGEYYDFNASDSTESPMKYLLQ